MENPNPDVLKESPIALVLVPFAPGTEECWHLVTGMNAAHC